MEGGGRELQVHLASRKVAKWKKNTFFFCFCSPKLQRVEGKQSRRVVVEFLIETVLKPQNTALNKSNHKKFNNFKKKISSSSIPKLTLYELYRGVFLSFILTKPILASLSKENWVSVYSADKNKKMILTLKKLACMLLEEKLGRKCPGIAYLCPGTASEEGKEGGQISSSKLSKHP